VVRFGTFKKPDKRELRKHRQALTAIRGKRMFEAVELQALLTAAGDGPMKAALLLGINCGFGNTDIAMLPQNALDLKAGWLDFPRPKTGIERRCPLWPETVAALRKLQVERPDAADPAHAHLAFITKYGNPWITTALRKRDDGEFERDSKGTLKIINNDALSKEMAKLLKETNLKRPGIGYYALRHTFETIAGGSKDQVAVNAIMGHDDASMAEVYREDLDDGRLEAVVEHVRTWLFGG
jgi:integrase